MTELEFFAQTLMVSRITLAVSIFVSIITIVFGSLSMAFQRSHNRKSVKPFCNIHAFKNNGAIDINIYNAGLGPMIISRTGFVRRDGKIKRDSVNIYDVLPDWIKCETGMIFSGEYIIPPMSERKVLELRIEEQAGTDYVEKLKVLLNEYHFFVSYRDLYERKYERIEHLIPVF